MGEDLVDSLADQDYPALYRAADQSSLQAQNGFLLATKVRLGSLIGAAFFALFVWKTEGSPVDWAGALALSCFAAALLAEIYLLAQKPERTWYEGRAAAESVKTLTWRYMMAAEPFGGQAASEVEKLFLARLDDVLAVLKELDLVVEPSTNEQITTRMRTVRSLPLEQRKRWYEEGRVSEQQRWYADKATWNRRRARKWTSAMLTVELFGVFAAILKTVGVLAGDLLGFAGAVVAAMTAWLQSKQHSTLAAAYGVTALELASVRSRISHQTTDAQWAAFVEDAEEAFSREHTLWKASRAVRTR